MSAPTDVEEQIPHCTPAVFGLPVEWDARNDGMSLPKKKITYIYPTELLSTSRNFLMLKLVSEVFRQCHAEK